MYSFVSILIIRTSLFDIDLRSLNVFETFIPATISDSQLYSSKLSDAKYISTSDVLAVSKVTIYIPSGLKYMLTSFNISLRTSKVDFIAEACTVANFIFNKSY